MRFGKCEEVNLTRVSSLGHLEPDGKQVISFESSADNKIRETLLELTIFTDVK